ncbi:MAG: Fe-S cluster assembly protein HesB [Acidobacteriota bacterium]|nr:Fe-S cluster assembly protein HesB [Acidobacteriota bacterium]
MFLEVPKQFNLQRTLYSHGWSELLPFEIDDVNWRLSYVFTGADLKQPVFATVGETEAGSGTLKIELSASEKISPKAQAKILRDARHILRLDDDLNEFYELVHAEEDLAWIAENNAGRLVRSPTVFEDLVKTLCTTNCNWAMTKKMTANLVEKLGEPTATGGKRAFPTAEAMANQTIEFYKNEIRAGYRAPYFKELAEKVVAGELNPEAWLHTDLPTRELKKEMKKVKGVGDYAADNLLKLVGRYDGLALDSWLRAQFYKKHNAETACDDKHIERHYDRFGAWRGLVMWCDMTRRWLDD